jgi:tetrahydromethanopterin S-methyltransferase subunit B
MVIDIDIDTDLVMDTDTDMVMAKDTDTELIGHHLHWYEH